MEDAPIPGQQYRIDSMNDLSPKALGELRSWLEGSGFQLPISQVVGFSQFTAQYATVGTEEAITSSSFSNLATVGPELTNLPPGKYLFLFGAALEGRPTDNATIAWMSLSFNGSTAQESDGIRQQGALAIPASRATITTLRSASNTVTAKYKWTSSGTPASNPTASYRWLVSLKYANP